MVKLQILHFIPNLKCKIFLSQFYPAKELLSISMTKSI